MSEFIVRNERERFAFDAMHLDFNGPLKLWRVTFEALTQSPVQFGIAGFPQLVADVDAREINVAATKPEQDFQRAAGILPAELAFPNRVHFSNIPGLI